MLERICSDLETVDRQLAENQHIYWTGRMQVLQSSSAENSLYLLPHGDLYPTPNTVHSEMEFCAENADSEEGEEDAYWHWLTDDNRNESDLQWNWPPPHNE
jgi:hypothetical protein